jgi:hypothetical protein
MRVAEVVVVAVLASGCGHVAPVISQDTGTVPDICQVDDHCSAGGTGTADTALTIAAVTAIVGVLGVVIVRRIVTE